MLANKQDVRGAMSGVDVSKALNLTAIKDRQWFIQESAAAKGQGLTEGFDWLVTCIQSSRK